MKNLAYTLDTDGSFDRVLKYPIEWLLSQWSGRPVLGQWADTRAYRPRNLQDRIRKAVENYPCELLFVHRDAEARSRDERLLEINRALDAIKAPPVVCIVPVRMTEAWLLFDENQLKQAAGNPRYSGVLAMPSVRDLDTLRDPKEVLFGLLRAASGAHGRRAKTFRPEQAAHRLAELISDFSTLRILPAFLAFEEDLRRVLQENGWFRE